MHVEIHLKNMNFYTTFVLHLISKLALPLPYGDKGVHIALRQCLSPFFLFDLKQPVKTREGNLCNSSKAYKPVEHIF